MTHAPAHHPARLVARTIELDTDAACDLLAVAGADGFLFEQEGHGIAGRGEAARIEGVALDGDLSVVADVLADIEHEGDLGVPGSRPVAIGAFAFDRTAPAALIIPRLLAGRAADGRRWITTIGPGGAPRPPLDLLAAEVISGLLPDSFTLTSPRPHPEWEATIADAVAAIADGLLDKVVVAREVLVDANRPIVVPDVLERLRALYPSCLVFSVDGFVGASPELLVERTGTSVRSHPLAGTYPRSGDPHADELLAAELVSSVKDQREHRFVIDGIEAALRPLCIHLDVPAVPEIMQLRNVLHLGTEIGGVLREPAPTALDLVASLHPTAAVAGTPTSAAVAWLDEHEGFARGRYAGPVGWVDARGDGAFAIGIRSAEVSGAQARLFAGVGIVEGSEPRRELAETQLKLQALLAAIVRP